jgi:hypothetical protein
MKEFSGENIFNEALLALKKGESIADITAKYPEEYTEDLLVFMSISSDLLAIPKISIPSPTKRFSYMKLGNASKPAWYKLTWVKVALMPLSALLVLGSTIYAGTLSSPGDNLFVVKKTTESIQLALIKNPEKELRTKLAITQDRLQEAETAVLTRDPNTAAVLNELSIQTQSTIEAIKKVAQADSSLKSDPSVITSLKDIAKKQKELLSSISNSNNDEATSAIKEAKKMLVAVNDQTLTTLDEESDVVTITGFVTTLEKTFLLVDKQTLSIDSRTKVIKDNDVVSLSSLSIKSKVTVEGLKAQDGSITAKLITIVETKVKETVKGASTKKPATEAPEIVTPEIDPNTATGSYIIETPEPLYTP